MRATLNEQPARRRWVLHALHYIPERRSKDIDIIADVIPLYNISFSIRVGKKTVRSVTCVPAGAALPFEQMEGRVSFVLPVLNGHQMVEIAF